MHRYDEKMGYGPDAADLDQTEEVITFQERCEHKTRLDVNETGDGISDDDEVK